MEKTPPRLDIRGPDGAECAVVIGARELKIGRNAPVVDLALGPDPQRLVSKLHCLIEQRDGQWYVIDNGSTNGTFLRHLATTERVDGIAPLVDGDVILFLGGLGEGQTPRFWELTFRDPDSVRDDTTFDPTWDPAEWLPPSQRARAAAEVCLSYDWVQARLYRVRDGACAEITNLRLQEQQLIRYMAERNRMNGNVPVLCTYEELIAAVWGEETHHTQADITHLAYELHKKLDIEGHPRLLETVRKSGCRLHTCPGG